MASRLRAGVRKRIRRRTAISTGGAALIVAILALAVAGFGVVDNSGSQNNAAPSQINTSSATQSSTATPSSTPTGNASEQSCSTTSGNAYVTLVAKQAQIQISKGVTYDAWTFNGTAPGPTIWVDQCEMVHFTLINNDTMPHSIDFHAAQVNWETDYAPVAPGKSISFDFVPSYPGIFMYHCGVPPVLEHISNGMYGVIIVNGTGSQALPEAPGGQYVITESEFYLNSQPNSDGSFSGNYTKMLAATPTYVVFNGEAFKYVSSPLVVKPNELVRLYIFNEGPNLWEAFHVIGGIMDTVYIDGNPANAEHGLQTLSIPPAGGAIVDMYFPDAGGENPFVNHAFAYAQAGAEGIFKVENSTTGTSATTTTTTSSSAVSGPRVSIAPGSAANTTSVYYSPPTITVVIGVNNTVTWVNNDDAPHTVTALDGSFDSGNMNPGQTWTYTFTTPGTYAYRCSYHSWMEGTVIVKSA
ncbi:MAG: cupredoxin domain-containing protein [Nitrososphaerales archaeon]